MTVVIFSLVSAAALVFYGVLLILTCRRGFDRAVTRWFALYLASMAIWSMGALMMYADHRNATAWNKVMLSGTALMPLAFYGFVQGFLSTRLHSRWVLLGAVLVVIVLTLTAQGYLAGDVSVTEGGLIRFSYGPATPLFGLYYFLFIGLSAYDLARELRTTRDFAARNRAKYVSLGLAVIVLGSLTNVAPVLSQYPLDIACNVINALLLAYAISRYHLLDLSVIVRKGLVYSLSTALVVSGYLVVVFLGVDLLHLVGGARLLLALLVAVAVAVVLQPGRDWAQGWVDRLFFRENYDAGLMLQRLSRQVASVLDLEQLGGLILDAVSNVMQISMAALLIRDKETGEYTLLAERSSGGPLALRLRRDSPIAAWLAAHDEVLTARDLGLQPQFKGLWAQERADLAAARIELFIGLTVHGELVGILALGPKRSEMPYTPDEQRTLQTLANQTAVAVQNAWLYGTALDEKVRAQTILQGAFAGIVVVDAELRVVAMNPGAEAITGRRLDAFRGRRLAELLGPELIGNGQPLALALADARPLTPVEVTLNAGGRQRDLLMGATPLPDGFVLNFADITRLKEVDRLKSEIVANVSHELRGPLANIMGYTELLLEEMDGEDRAQRRRFLSVINEETERLAEFINEMLDLSRLEAGHVELELAPASLGLLLADVARSLEMQARAAGVTIQTEVPAGLPLALVDRALMHSALKNLVSNAIKFSPSGAAVTLAAHAAGPVVVVEVIDRGLGIPPEDVPHLFTKFYRGSTARQASIVGTGLGLVLARQAVELHHGTITVATQPGKGTRFTVTLPVAATSAGAEDTERAVAPLGVPPCGVA